MDFSELGTVAFGAFTAVETPQLETIAFSPLQTEIIFPELSHAPHLRNVKYGDGIEEGSLDDVPWNGVHRLELAFDNTCTPSSVFKVLRLGYNLKSLVYYGEANVGWVNPTLYERNEGGPQPVSSNLETLSVQLGCAGGFYNLLHDFIRSLKLPFLDNLAVSFLEPSDLKDREVLTFGTTSWPRDVFIQFMERSGCNLTTLTLEGIPLAETEVMSLLNHTTTLRSFTLCELFASSHEVSERRRWEHMAQLNPKRLHKTVTESFLRHLEAPTFGVDVFSTQCPIVPSTYLKLGVQSHFNAHRAFVDMVKSRWDRPNGDTFSYRTERLRTAVLHVLNGTVEELIYEPLKRLDEKGMMVSVLANGKWVV
ncbi:hypothetical protein PM082_022941 [Marasmius tenuissimus]|nr:hypothetical protein PM082_022941 [Marasmius tenuissimus]